MNIRKQFEKETDTPAYIHGQLYPHFNSDYVKWLEQRNKEQVEVLESLLDLSYNAVSAHGYDPKKEEAIQKAEEQLNKSSEL